MKTLSRYSTTDSDFGGAPASLAAGRPESRKNDRVVTLASLSSHVPHRLISSNLARKLRQETDQTVLLVHLTLSRSEFSLHSWMEGRKFLNGAFMPGKHVQSVGDGVWQLTLQLSTGPMAGREFRELVDHCKNHYHYILFHVGAELPEPFLLDSLSCSDMSFLFLQPTARDLYERDLFLRQIRSQWNGAVIRLKTILCREKGEEHFNDLLKKMGASIHGYVHGCPATRAGRRVHVWRERHFQDDLRRLAREIGHCRVGLVLSSGGARGLSHIGVIQVLEENGIEIDVVAGCSMGSYVGAVWAYGFDGVAMEKLAREVERRWGLLELIDPFILPRQGFLRGEKVKRRLKRSIGDVHFSELLRPLRIVATNLFTLEREVFASGEVAEAVHASSAIPGACAPVKVNEEYFIDGGICDPLPVGVMQDMGIERVIAVNTIPTPAYLRCGKEMEREQLEMMGRRPGKISGVLNKYLNYFAPGNILDTIFRSFHGAQIRVAEQSCAQADLVLRPLCLDGRWHDFRHPGKYIAIGRREAEARVDEIKSLVNRKGPVNDIYEHKHSENAMASLI